MKKSYDKNGKIRVKTERRIYERTRQKSCRRYG